MLPTICMAYAATRFGAVDVEPGLRHVQFFFYSKELQRLSLVDVLRAVLRQIRPLTFGNWPLPYKEIITWYIYILPEMTSYVYSGHEILPPHVHRVYITWTSHVFDRSRQNEVKGHMRAKYSIFTLSLQVQNEPRHWARAGNRYQRLSDFSRKGSHIVSVPRTVCERS